MISIIIPCSKEYQKYLKDSQPSVEKQLGTGDELLVVPFIPGVDKFVDVLNAAISKAKNEYILMLGADDKLADGILDVLKHNIDDSDVYYGKLKCFDGCEIELSPNQHITLDDFRANNQIYWTSMFRKEAWKIVGGLWVPNEPFPEDWYFWAQLMKAGCKFKYINTIFFHYRTYPEQSWNQMKHKFEEFKKVINTHL